MLSLEREPWASLEVAQRETWIATSDPRIQTVWVQGTARSLTRSVLLASRKLLIFGWSRAIFDRLLGTITFHLPVSQHNQLIRVRAPEYWVGTSAKMHAALRYVSKTSDFDYLVRTNSSTYLDIAGMMAFLEAAPRSRYYAGSRNGEARHARGTCIILSRDIVDRMSEDHTWRYDWVDDRAMGASALKLGVEAELYEQVFVTSEDAIPQALADKNRSFIFRLKTRGDRRSDIRIMKALHDALTRRAACGDQESAET